MVRGAVSWSFGEQDSGRIDSVLRHFLTESSARCALLVDRTGQLITSTDSAPEFDATSFASLAAADFSANDQLASMIGENEFSSLFHQGENESMFLADVAGRVIFVALFDNRATLGLVRLKARGVVRQLSEIFRDVFERNSGPAQPSLETEFVAEVEDEIDRLFGDM